MKANEIGEILFKPDFPDMRKQNFVSKMYF